MLRFKKPKWIQWLKYSGGVVSLSLNPWHWRIVPWFRPEFDDVWVGPNQKTWEFGFLAITIRVWVDNGDW
jgi:hypothetical protein